MNNQKNYCILPALLSVLALFYSATAQADMYKYIDDSGTVAITDDVSKVPEKYRSKIEVVKEQKIQVVATPPEDKEKKADSKEPSVVSSKITDKLSEGRIKSFADNKQVLLGAIAGSVVFFVALLVVLNKYVKNRVVARLIFMFIMALVSVALYKLLAENMYKQFSDAKKSTEQAKKLLEQKQKEQMKEIGDIGK